MRKFAIIFVLVSVALLASTSSFAQPAKGNKEVGFQGFYTQIITEGVNVGSLVVIGNLGYYLTETSEVRGGGLLFKSFGAGDDSTRPPAAGLRGFSRRARRCVSRPT